MAKSIICSVGTSAAKHLELPPSQLRNWVNQSTSIEEASIKLFESFKDFKPLEDNLQNNLSAEIHSLVRIGIDSSDRIILLGSETDDGYCCALAIKLYLEYYWPGIRVVTIKVSGLQVNDANKFKTRGVVEFVRHIIKEIEGYGSENVILNPTGGYKALVPYTVLLGMLKGVKCDYIFEQSTSLLELPPLPIEFRRSQFESYRNLFDEILKETSISLNKWESRVPFQDRFLFDSLVEIQDNLVTLSAIGFMFLDEMQEPSSFTPFLSQRAIDDCFKNLALLDDCDPFRFLLRVATSKEAFRQAEHINMGDGMRWLKPGNTTDRYLVSIEGWRLLVWRAIREDQVGSKYASEVKIDPKKDRRSYSPFMRMEFIQ